MEVERGGQKEEGGDAVPTAPPAGPRGTPTPTPGASAVGGGGDVRQGLVGACFMAPGE